MIITKILITLSLSFKYFISAWNQLNERTLNLISMLTIKETRTGIEEKSENILLLISINIRKILKKATLDQMSLLSQTRALDQGMQKSKNSNEKYTGRKGEALIGAMSQNII